MGKKGAKRKTRWRSLSIGAPPGEEDEEEEVHNGYQIENRNGSLRGERNMQGGYSSYKRTRPYNNATNTYGYGYGYGSLYNGQSKSSQSKDEDPTKPKIVFNEEEYMRITTPRQDVLFKKGYLSRKKPLASTASTSATSATTTPSTNESQSAAHSTADGSETAEDQQLLDGSNGAEFAIVPEPAAQFVYGGFYDQVTGYYYEYPVMLVSPPVAGHPSPNALAAMSCGPVPLRPVEWFNPQYIPESSQDQHAPLHSIDSQAGSCGSSVSMDEVNGTGAPTNVEAVTGSENKDEEVAEVAEDAEGSVMDKTTTDCAHSAQIIPQLVSHMHMPPQHYVYPGHFMFGPPMVNMNGMTIQNGAIIPNETLWAKRRKKKKRRKQKRPLAVGNTEDEEEEYSSEWESSSNWSQPAWSTSTPTIVANDAVTSRPLNPEVEEFQFRTKLSVLPDIVDPTPDSEYVGVPLSSASIETEHKKCEEVKTENDARISSINNINLSNVVNTNTKDKLSENTSQYKRVKEINQIDPAVSDITNLEEDISANKQLLLTERNEVIVNRNSETLQDYYDGTDKNTLVPSSNQIIISNNNETFVESNVVNEVDEKCEASARIQEGDTINPPNNIESKTALINNITEVAAVDRPLNSCTVSCSDHESIAPNNNGNCSDPNSFQQNNLKESVEINGEIEKSVASEINESNSSSDYGNKKLENEISNKKSGNKNVKKSKGKAMDTRKTLRNKRESRNPQQNDTVSRVVSTEFLQEKETAIPPETEQLLDTENSNSQFPFTEPGLRPTCPEINQTTTPISAEIHRLPESSELLVNRSNPPLITPPLPADAPIAPPPRRKYSAKGLKFVREPTPGPDLDTEPKSDNEEGNKISDNLIAKANMIKNMPIDQEVLISAVNNTIIQESNEDENTSILAGASPIITDHRKETSDKNSVSTLENGSKKQGTVDECAEKDECQLESGDFTHTSDSNKSDTLCDISVQENVFIDSSSGINCQENADVGISDVGTTSRSSNYPITDAVAAWLERTKSPEMFRIPMPISESDDSDLSETEIYDGDPNRQPAKNLKGNPMPALSVSNGSIDDDRNTRSNVITSGPITKTDTFDTSNTIKRRREKDTDNTKHISPINKNETAMEEESLGSVGVCEITTKDSAAGMRVAENSRVDLNRINIKQKRLTNNSKTNYIENIEMQVKDNVRLDDDDIAENGIDALENVKTFERGEIVVLDGKLLTGTIYEPLCSKKSYLRDPEIINHTSESNNNQGETLTEYRKSINLDKPFVTLRNSEHETSPEGTVNSFGSIEEPDVLECWETEIIEPIATLKYNRQATKLQVDGEVYDGEATEEENFDNHSDPKTKEHVKKYYRLAREYTISVEEELSEKALKQINSNNFNSTSNSPKKTTPNTPERMIECLCSEEIPIIMPLPKSTSLTKVNKVMENGKEIEAIDEAFEVYESCYTEKSRLSGVPHLNVEGSKIPFQNQEGPIPCKAVCCNIQ